MRASISSSAISRLAGAVAAVWLCGSGAAWAGGGSGDLGTVQTFLSALCPLVNISASSCPQLPTVTQGVLELAALGNSPPEITHVRTNNLAGTNVYVGNPAVVNIDVNGGLAPMPFPIDSNSSPPLFQAADPINNPLPPLLPTLTPLAFISQSSGTTAAMTQLVDPNADAFLFAVPVSSVGFQAATSGPVPDKAYFFYDDLFRTNKTFVKGQIAAKFSLPLTILKNGTEDPPVMVTLLIKATCTGGPACLQAYAFGGQIGSSSNPVPASQLGIQFALVFSASPASSQTHAIFEVAVPLLVTGKSCTDHNGLPIPGCTPNTDPPYFYFSDTGFFGPRNLGTVSAFGALGNALGVTFTTSPAISYIGLAPSALAPSSDTGPIFQLCASLPDNSNGPNAHLRSAVGAYYAIATDGEMLLSAAFPSSSTSACPAL
jgi:hypothetical protein